MNRLLFLLFGLFCYALFGVTSSFAFCFLGNLGLPNTIDSPATGHVALAIAVNLGLLGLFAVQHSVMARPWFKRWWTRFVPQPIERSVYCFLSCVALGLLIWLWQPVGFVLWDIQSPPVRGLLFALYVAGWLTVVASSWHISHFELFGLRQVWLHYRGLPNEPLPFITPGAYRFVRHPLYVGWLLVFWSAPTMTASHLLFAAGTTIYILLAIQWEERDLIAHFGETYENYRRRVPMLLPWSTLPALWRGAATGGARTHHSPPATEVDKLINT
jgi:protein-S-isoprenylcysteine O-methyltransferase Ste14